MNILMGHWIANLKCFSFLSMVFLNIKIFGIAHYQQVRIWVTIVSFWQTFLPFWADNCRRRSQWFEALWSRISEYSSCTFINFLHWWRQRHLTLSRVPYWGACRKKHVPRGCLSSKWVIKREKPKFIDVISSHAVINNVLIISFSLFLVYGNLPTKDQLSHWEATITQHSALPEGVLVCL